MVKPILVVMAAGIGSRYGGLKQTDPIGPNNELIIDYSVFDAIQAGFKKVIFIINKSIEVEFKEIIGNRLEPFINVDYAFQDLEDIPIGTNLPTERIKPLGTAHAIYAARHLIDAPFAVINADDFYGKEAFVKIYNYLSQLSINDYNYTMVSYLLKNTITENGYVSRGICTVDEKLMLTKIVERVHIELQDNTIAYQEDNSWHSLADDLNVSMNLWGFTPSILPFIEENLITFLNDTLPANPLKSEYFLPFVVDKLIEENTCCVKVLQTNEKWYGVTYSQDKKTVVNAISDMIQNGIYPKQLWEV